jgi:hypothetical protein
MLFIILYWYLAKLAYSFELFTCLFFVFDHLNKQKGKNRICHINWYSINRLFHRKKQNSNYHPSFYSDRNRHKEQKKTLIFHFYCYLTLHIGKFDFKYFFLVFHNCQIHVEWRLSHYLTLGVCSLDAFRLLCINTSWTGWFVNKTDSNIIVLWEFVILNRSPRQKEEKKCIIT